MPSQFPREIDDAGLKASLFSLLEERVVINAISYFPAEDPSDYPQLILRLILRQDALIQPEEYQGLCAILMRHFRADNLSPEHILIRDDFKTIFLDKGNHIKGRLADGQLISAPPFTPERDGFPSTPWNPEGMMSGYEPNNGSSADSIYNLTGYYSYDPQSQYYDPQNPDHDPKDAYYQGYYDENGQYVQAQGYDANAVNPQEEALFACHFQPDFDPQASNKLYLELDPLELSPFTGTLILRAAERSVFRGDDADSQSISLQPLSLSYFLTSLTLTLRALTLQAPMDLQIFNETTERPSAALQQALFLLPLPEPDKHPDKLKAWREAELTAPGPLRDLQAFIADDELRASLPIGYCLPLPTDSKTIYLGYLPATNEVILSCIPVQSSASESDSISLCNLFLPRRYFITAILNCCRDFLNRLSATDPDWANHPACQALKAQMSALAEMAI